MRHRGLLLGVTMLAAPVLGAQRPSAGPVLVVRNNHELRYDGPVSLDVALPDGAYGGERANGTVRDGHLDAIVSLPPKGSVVLRPTPTLKRTRQGEDAPLTLTPVASGDASLALQWRARRLADLSLGLVSIAGTSATVDDALRGFRPLALSWRTGADGTLQAVAEQDGYRVLVTARAHGGGWLDVGARVLRVAPAAGKGYLALVRRAVSPAARDARVRFNGREFASGDSPDTWDRDFWYTRGADWLRWRTGGTSVVVTNAFTPVPTVKRDTTWGEGSHFYVWERTRQHGDTLWMVSEIAGPNAEQAKSRYMPVTPYAALLPGDTVRLRSRLSVSEAPTAGWEEAQLRASAGSVLASRAGDTVRVDVGVPYVTFGIAYFPYSTFVENLDYYRTAGTNSESFWPTSAAMVRGWRAYMPRIRTDLRIVRAMGFDAVRLHHLELLRAVERDTAFAFLDFYAGEARALGLTLMMDSEGPEEWVGAVLSRYRDVVTRVELENEVLIGGISPGDPARWKGLYAAAKRAAPDAQVLFTGAGNNAMFERLRMEGVPFDRVGVHAYKHGPQWKEAYASHMLGTGGYAASLGRGATLGEYDWKDLTRMTPEQKGTEFAEITRQVLMPRAIGEVIQFQLQEQASFNTTVNGTQSRHYEPLGMDRRPKPEAAVITAAIRAYGRPDAPVTVLPVTVAPATVRAGGSTTTTFTVTNRTGRAAVVSLAPESFDGTTATIEGATTMRLAAGATGRGRIRVSLPAGAMAGTYHAFVTARTGGVASLGWAVVSHEGAPTFADTSVLGAERVRYADGPAAVRTIDWTTRPLVVAYGDKTAVLELEQAFQLGNTLQAATGRVVRVVRESDVTAAERARATLLLVGTPATNALVAATGIASGIATGAAGTGTIAVHAAPGGARWLVLSGRDAKGVEAATVELELRYWPNAKDASMRITGMEPGAALGHRKQGSSVDLP